MISRPIHRMLALAVTAAFAACASPVKTGYDADPGTDFSKYRTFAWVTEDLMSENDPTASSYISPLDDGRVRREVEGLLEKKGMEKRPLDEADVVIGFTVKREVRIKQNIDPGTRVYYPGAYPRTFGYGGMAVSYDQYTEGTLTFHVFDRRTQKLVWTGFGSKRLTKKHEAPEVIQEVVAHIFAKYPPPAS